MQLHIGGTHSEPSAKTAFSTAAVRQRGWFKISMHIRRIRSFRHFTAVRHGRRLEIKISHIKISHIKILAVSAAAAKAHAVRLIKLAVVRAVTALQKRFFHAFDGQIQPPVLAIDGDVDKAAQ